MGIFKAIRRRWRIWKVRHELRANTRERLELNDRIRKAKERHEKYSHLSKRSTELTTERIRIERRARIWA